MSSGSRGVLRQHRVLGRGRIAAATRTILTALAACIALHVGANAFALPKNREYTFDIPPMPLGAAVREFSRSTGLNTLYVPSTPQEEKQIVGPIKGRYTADAALIELLKPVGLSYAWTNARTVTVIAPSMDPPAGAGVGEQSLRVSIFDGSDPTDVTQLINFFDTPGDARAVSVYNGLAYVADGPAGLQVLNYLAFDTLKQPPTISLSTSAASGQIEEGKRFRVTASVNDDVQVRNVEFYLDGVRIATDGNFPFEHRFVTPLITPQKTSFTLRARASDTGGNAAFSEEVVINLTPDATPPEVVRVTPANAAIIGSANTLAAYFNEPIIASTVSSASFRLIFAGPDNIIGTSDDAPVPSGTIDYRDNLNAAFLSFGAELTPGVYRAILGPPIADLKGNVMAGEFSSSFRVLGFADADSDGVPDTLEASLGLNPLNRDSDSDGIPDGLEDRDFDGLPNVGEVLLGTNPQLADTDGDGTLDGAEDSDNDGFTDGRETVLGTNPLAVDSDADGWSDEAEVVSGSDPLNPNSRPVLFFAGLSSANVLALGLASSDGSGTTAIAGSPPTSVLVLGIPSGDGSGSVAITGQPPVEVRFE